MSTIRLAMGACNSTFYGSWRFSERGLLPRQILAFQVTNCLISSFRRILILLVLLVYMFPLIFHLAIEFFYLVRASLGE